MKHFGNFYGLGGETPPATRQETPRMHIGGWKNCWCGGMHADGWPEYLCTIAGCKKAATTIAPQLCKAHAIETGVLAGAPVSDVPKGEIHFRDKSGKTVGKIVNIMDDGVAHEPPTIRDVLGWTHLALAFVANYGHSSEALRDAAVAIQQLAALARQALRTPADADTRWAIMHDPLCHAAYTMGKQEVIRATREEQVL